MSLVFVSTYPPTRCGLATFTKSLVGAVSPPLPSSDVDVIQAIDEPTPVTMPEVVHQFVQGSARSRDEALEVMSRYDVAVLQHEYGIYGGEAGEDVVAFLAASPVPTIVVLHTVLSQPSRHRRDVLERVVDVADRVVVVSNDARQRLAGPAYTVDGSKIFVIPHGAVDNRGDSPARPDGRATILTWGLIGPGKGIEWGIDALVGLRDLDPPPRYLIVGATHPKVKAQTGERYREQLRIRAEDAGVGDLVEFDDAYKDQSALLELIRSANVVLLPYESREQVSSGVLVEALASGRPVVATRFPHAVELLAGGAGLLVPHEDAGAIAAALRRLITEPDLALRAEAEASRLATFLFWPSVGARYVSLAAELTRERVRAEAGA
jgi:polysaccharide biosynthesis protein PslF